MQGNKGRLIAVILALVLGLGGVFMLVQYVQTSADRAAAGTELVQVYVATQDIPAGTSALGLDVFVELAEVPAGNRVPGAVTDISALGSQVLSIDVLQGEQIVEARFTEEFGRTIAGQEQPVPDGLFETTVNISAERFIGGQVEPGQTVAILATSAFGTDPSLVDPTETRFVLREALLVNIQSAEFVAPVELTDNDAADSDRDRGVSEGDFMLTFALNPEDTQKLVFAAETMSLWLTLEPDLPPPNPDEPMNLATFLGAEPVVGAEAPETLASAEENVLPSDAEIEANLAAAAEENDGDLADNG